VTGWLETYRGAVYRWEVDHNDHLTVAYYFARLGHATLALLDALGLAGDDHGGGWLTTDCHVRYARELRVGDIMHVSSAPIGVESDGFVTGHKLVDTGTGELTSTFSQRLTLVDADGAPLALPPDARERLAARRQDWDGPAREHRGRPARLDGLRPGARDTIEASVGDGSGPSALAAYVHRFSAANSHILAAFGMTPGYMRQHRRGFSTFEFQFGAAQRLRPGMPVVVCSGVLHVGSSSLRLFHLMTDARTGAEIATLHQAGVHFDQELRRPTPLPPELAERARALVVPTTADAPG
jgi:acyl-CoA thioester hydrolase